ncbi:MAG: hypothetical protein U1F57_02920 [bacterium]
MLPSELKVIPVESKGDFKRFVRFPYQLYRNDPRWVPPLYLERKEVLSPKKNPYYLHAEVKLFLALRGSEVVGRISAQIDREYEKRHGERVGHFGFFECEDNSETAQALFFAAETFLKNGGAIRSQGPFSFSINEESGLMVEGFDQPFMTLMPYNPLYYARLVEGAGYLKAKDLYAWYYKAGAVPDDAVKLAEEVAQYPGLKLRSVEKKNFKQDLLKIIDIFNSAWSENWGFVPLTEAEVDKMAKDLQLFMDLNGAILAEVDGKPVGMCVAVPNLYDLIGDLKGKLFPFGIFKLLWRIKKKKYKSGRLLLLGIKKEHRKTILGGLSFLLYVEIHRRAHSLGYEWGELSWTLEDNKSINAGIEFMGGKRYKTYRIYEKSL